jgi:hypothetical protein
MHGSCKVALTVLLLLMAACQDKTTAIKTVSAGKGIKMGMIVDGKLSGLGLTASETNQIENIGSWKADTIDGLGLRTNKIFTDIGEFTNGSMNGKGLKKSLTGDLYLGNFVADNYQGKGVLYYSDGRTYTGTFNNNVPEGRGILQYPNGNIYIGQFKNGVAEGDGMLLLANGKRIVGKFAHDEPSTTTKVYDR